MNLPNKLTVLRIRIAPVFILVIGLSSDWGQLNVGDTTLTVTQLVGAAILALASITDWLDGETIRVRGLVANFGKFTDPLADKMLAMTAFIMLVDQGKAPGWVVAITACRELAVTDSRLLFVEHGEVMAAAWPGRVKTATQMVAITLLFINNILFSLTGIPADQIMPHACLISTIYSGVGYFIKSNGVFRGSM